MPWRTFSTSIKSPTASLFMSLRGSETKTNGRGASCCQDLVSPRHPSCNEWLCPKRSLLPSFPPSVTCTADKQLMKDTDLQTLVCRIYMDEVEGRRYFGYHNGCNQFGRCLCSTVGWGEVPFSPFFGVLLLLTSFKMSSRFMCRDSRTAKWFCTYRLD